MIGFIRFRGLGVVAVRRSVVAAAVLVIAACGGSGQSGDGGGGMGADGGAGRGGDAGGGDDAAGGGGGDMASGATGCAAHTNCGDCLADGACGWCNASNSCLEGTANGPDTGMCSRNWIVSGFGSCGGGADGGIDNQYGPTTLPVDCRIMANWSDPHCQDSTKRMPAQVGKGPTIYQANIGATITGCFVDAPNHRLISGATLDNGSGTPLGAVFAVDLTTGDRTLVSGLWADPSTGMVMPGSGPQFGAVYDVKPGAAGGKWYVATKTQIFTVDPATGARALFWDGTSQTTGCMAGGQLVTSYSGDLALASDGTIYLAGGLSAPGGVYAVKNGQCTVVELFDGTKGSGPNLTSTSAYKHITVLASGAVYADEFPSNDVYSINLTSGNWKVVSSSDASGPVGMGGPLGSGYLIPYMTSHLLVRGDDGNGSTVYTDVDPASGNRVTYAAVDQPGPKPPADRNCLALYPNQPWFIVDDVNAWTIYETSTGLTNDISY